jgi:hypothetical protein
VWREQDDLCQGVAGVGAGFSRFSRSLIAELLRSYLSYLTANTVALPQAGEGDFAAPAGHFHANEEIAFVTCADCVVARNRLRRIVLPGFGERLTKRAERLLVAGAVTLIGRLSTEISTRTVEISSRADAARTPLDRHAGLGQALARRLSPPV